MSLFHSDEAFSTYTHVSNEECSAYDDISKRMQQKAKTKDGKIYYPCNIGGCMEPCPCLPCSDTDKYKEPNSFKCP